MVHAHAISSVSLIFFMHVWVWFFPLPTGHLIQFSVNVNKCAQFSYHGAGLLEIRDDQMIVWSQGEREEVVRWKLGHIRSFKAKLSILEIIAGRSVILNYKRVIVQFRSECVFIHVCV